MAVVACYITKSVELIEERKDIEKSKSILNNFEKVNVNNNYILDAILESYDTWDKSPIIWVDNFPYKIKIIEKTKKQVIMYQMTISMMFKNSGKSTYKVLTKRKVKIEFA
jgi:hypothetical protein